MKTRQGCIRWFRWSACALLVAMASAWIAPAGAGELDKLDASLKLIPEDAAFYVAALRNREVFEAVRRSNAWAKVMQMPVVKMGIGFYETQAATPNSGPAKFNEAMKNPETRKVADLLLDMISEDAFIYGDESCTDFVALVQEVIGSRRYDPAMQADDQTSDRTPGQSQAVAMLSALAENAELIGVPNFALGFKVKNLDLAKEQLIKLETIGNIVLEGNEKTKGRFKKTKVGDYDYLVLELDGQMVPWDEVPLDKFKELEAEEGDTQKVVDRIKEAKLVVAVGLRDNYLVALVGSSLECLEKLGQSPRLIDRKELKPLEKFADKPLVRIGYMSEAMSRQIGNQEKNVDDVRKTIDAMLAQCDLSDEQSEQIDKDLEGLADDLKTLMPQPGASMGFCFLADRGIEGYSYNWGEFGRIDGSKPLGLLEHVGGNPILGVVSRAKVGIEDYDMLCKWAKTGYGYVKQFALPSIPDEERAKVEQFLQDALPLVERFDKVNREKLIPALADGQSALVIDGKLQSTQFLETLPATEKPMPMVEPAIVLGVSDAKLLKEGLSELRAIINGLIDAASKVEGVEVPNDFEIPAAQVAETSLGNVYSYALPKDWGVDPAIGPCLAIGSDVAVIALTKNHAERLLKPTPLSVGGVLQKADRPMAMAVWFRWASLLETAAPWIDFAAEQTLESKGLEGDSQGPILDQVHTGAEVLKAIQAVSDESYLEDGVLVHHMLLEIHDVQK